MAIAGLNAALRNPKWNELISPGFTKLKRQKLQRVPP